MPQSKPPHGFSDWSEYATHLLATSGFQPQCGMWIIQGTVTRKSGKGTVSPQFATFYIHPEVQGCSNRQSAERVAVGILNPTKDPNITPNVSAHLVSVASLSNYTEEELTKMDPDVHKLF